jgi:glycyl-tRNA synthetase
MAPKAPTEDNLMEKIVSLAKRRGFVFPGSEIYGGLANSWDYGPLGVELKNNIKKLWWDRFVHRRDDMVGLDSALIMNPKVWEASGHLSAGFADPLVECKKCHTRYRADQIDITQPCGHCGAKGMFTETKQFNLMFKTFVGPAEEEANIAYFRPETAQGIFVDFKNILDTTRRQLPFGVAQIGKAFRNEITPGNFIFRTREFEQMEIEYFIAPPGRNEDWASYFEMWRKEMHGWMEEVGIEMEKVHELDVPDGDRAHYSKRTIDFEFDYPFGRKELYGLAYRTDFDLKNHFKEAPYRDAQTGESFWPHVIEPSLGVDRTLLAVLLSAYKEDGDRVVLKLPPKIAPYKAAVFPLLANKEPLVKAARAIYDDLRKQFVVAWDDRGNIGKRYYAQDEIGTPYCITVDFDTLGEEDGAKKGTVTVRDRDTGKQERVAIDKLALFLLEKTG